MTEGAFIDAVCPRCHKRIGWCGRIVDRPPCPRCGYQVPRDDLEAEQEKMDASQRMLAELRQANAGWERWREARLAAGLSLGQAAKLLEIGPAYLSGIEMGRERPSEALASVMARCYGGESPASE